MNEPTPQPRRQQWMAILARAPRADLEAIAGAMKLPDYELLKAPETGSVMIEGRAGGTGGRFNLGEATITKCVVRIDGGVVGHAYALGRDKGKVQIAAVLDAVLQTEAADGPVHARIGELKARQSAERAKASCKAAATKVEFFTLVRGE